MVRRRYIRVVQYRTDYRKYVLNDYNKIKNNNITRENHDYNGYNTLW